MLMARYGTLLQSCVPAGKCILLKKKMCSYRVICAQLMLMPAFASKQSDEGLQYTVDSRYLDLAYLE